jgi:enolase-phosphatase E1
MKYILMDVEGTTTSISFVHDILFPFSKARIETFVKDNLKLDLVTKSIDEVKATALSEENILLDLNGAISKLKHWIEIDRKHPALKSLQGMIWKSGYTSSEIKGHVYDDVAEALANWKKYGLQLGVYSSGSVEAQKDLFAHSIAGDLSTFFSHHFDTEVGHKREITSYQKIASTLNLSASDIVFLSDIKEELDAAKAAGFATIQLVRNPPLELQGHTQALSFNDIRSFN